jgi:DNA polymerase III subunit gamma/tau
MSYTVLARKYRPQVFADLAGQEHVSRTLANAIAAGRVAHAFLFTGARGVGKTTTARLLAKALNCEQGPTAEPCNQCSPCREITAGNDLDVLEIDGASNNSVDDVRRLQESLPFRPARDRFKVVIVDEVHMLSSGAFNAFLKTLEEPPEHVKFIFATTEIHKVPITIRSRCQRHDFRLIPRTVVAARVKEILAKENITADEEAVSIVVREADGSLRDALTVLDQLLAFGGQAELKGEEVARGLGIADRRHVLQVAEAMLGGDAATCVRNVGSLAGQGLDIVHFARQLLGWMRDLVVLRVVGDSPDLIDRSDEERQQAAEIAQAHSAQHLERSFAGLSKLLEEVFQSADPQLTLEMGLVRLADRPPLEPLAELLSRLQALEQRLAPGGGTPSPGRESSGPGGGGGGPGGAGRGPRRAPV